MFELDHIVHYTNNPEKAASTLEKLGVYSNPGGRHEQFGTYNILSYFDNLTYIELIGSFDKELVKKSAKEPYTLWNQFDKHHYQDNLERIALRHNDLNAVSKRLKQFNLDVYGPYPYSRKTPDGNEIHWELLYAIDKNSDLTLPFFIDWKRSNSEREAELKEQGSIKPHKLGDLAIQSVGFAVKDAEAAANKWAQFFEFETGENIINDDLNAEGKSLIVENKSFVFYEPKGEGIAQHYLEEQGEGPFLITITGSSEEKTVEINGTLYHFKN
ncbi:conserved hypothetical protein [Carnobacterium sp. 17-4]|uniref:VOC family protein n=1 Tax=Carnobacterium sp. (strain 17-4) TaxID=208596 RepID=UPI00020584F0|nr:VOC family protein [Carnobacterium sp. 17-4]AEB29881.1 conserved hypothetical protein [Carnobacterium sp. 17-4]